MKRGELWTIAGGADYAGKPRPALILQSDAYAETESITLCPLTSERRGTQDIRVVIKATAASGLGSESRAMVDKMSTLSRRKVGLLIGTISEEEMAQVESAIMIFLGLAG